MKAVFTLGRVVFGGFFLYNAINHITQHRTLSQYAAAKNVPMPDKAVALSTALLLLGGTGLVSGAAQKLGAISTIAFLAGVSPMIHDFWNIDDPQQKQAEMINFSKNVALLGAALALLASERSHSEA